MVSRAARSCGIPTLSIDNQHTLTRTDVASLKFDWWSTLLLMSVINLFAPISAKNYFITSFFPAKPLDEQTKVFPALVRPEVVKRAGSGHNSDHILVYCTSKDKRWIERIMHLAGDQRFIVYGYNRHEAIGSNIELKKFDETVFLDDLAACRAVIATPGSNLVAEALYLKKPFLAIPVRKQLEQMINGYYLEKLGYGLCADKLTDGVMKSFLEKNSFFKQNLIGYNQTGNTEILTAVDNFILQTQKGS